MDVKTWLTDWLILRSPELKPRTIESYQDIIARYIIPSVGSLDVAELRAEDLRHLLATITASGKTRTSELCYVTMKCAFQELDPSPMAKVKRPKHRQRARTPWKPSEMAVYEEACKTHPHGLALSLALFLGLRRGEICGLRWKDIDFDREVVKISNQRQRLATGEIVDCSPKSETSNREIPLTGKLLAMLRKHRGLPEAYVCTLTPSGLDAAHRALVISLDLPYITLHDLRHTFATNALRNGGEMRALQSVLGHASYTTTANIYTHPDTDMKKAIVDAASVL